MDLKFQKNLNWFEDDASEVLSTDVTISKSETETMFKKISHLIEVHDQQKENILNLSKRLKHQTSTVETAITKNQHLEMKNLQLTQKINEQLKSYEDLKIFLYSVESSYSEILKHKNASLERLENSLKQTKLTVLEIQNQNQEQQSQIESLREKLQESNRKIENLKASILNFKTLEIVYEEKLESLALQMAQVKSTERENVERLQSEMNLLQSKTDELLLQKKELEKKSIHLERLNLKLNQEMLELQKQHQASFENQKSELEKTIANQQMDLQKLQKENEILKGSIEIKDSNLKKLNDNLIDIQKNYFEQIGELNSRWQLKIDEIKTEKEIAEKSSDRLSVENRHLLSENLVLKTESQHRNELLSRIDHERLQMVTENKILSESMKMLHAENLKMQMQLDQVKVESLETKAKFSELLREINQITGQLQPLKGSSEPKIIMESLLVDLIQELDKKIKKLDDRSDMLKELISAPLTDNPDTESSSVIVQKWMNSIALKKFS